MQLSIRNNIRQVERGLSDVARREIPFAVARAITETLRDIERNMLERMALVLDRPTLFTRKAWVVERASKRNLRGAIFAKDKQAGYLTFAETGGVRTPQGRALTVPTGRRRNRFGNVPRGGLKADLAKPKVFSGVPRGNQGPAGIYQRLGRAGRGALRQLYIYTPRARYTRKPLGFGKTARRTAEKRLPILLDRFIRAGVQGGRQ